MGRMHPAHRASPGAGPDPGLLRGRARSLAGHAGRGKAPAASYRPRRDRPCRRRRPLSATPIAPPKRAGNPSKEAAPTARASSLGGRVASRSSPQTVLTAHRLHLFVGDVISTVYLLAAAAGVAPSQDRPCSEHQVLRSATLRPSRGLEPSDVLKTRFSERTGSGCIDALLANRPPD